MSEWKPIETAPENTVVDVWLDIDASPSSSGWGDSFRVPDAYRQGDKWFHRAGFAEKELAAKYVTHWMPIPEPPKEVIE